MGSLGGGGKSTLCPSFLFNVGDGGSQGMETFQGMLVKFYNCCESSLPVILQGSYYPHYIKFYSPGK